MKRTVVFGVAVLCLFRFVPSCDAAAGLTILSGEQRVWGYIGGRNVFDQTDTFEFAYDSGTVPWSGSALSGSTGPYHGTFAQSDTDALYVHVNAEGSGTYYGYDAYASAGGKGTWVFQPNGSTLRLEKIDFKLGVWLGASCDVDDLTTGQSLYHYDGTGDDWWHSSPWTDTVEYISVDPGHEYRLSVALSAGANDDTVAGAVRVTVIPAPASLLLALAGFALVKSLRHRIS